MGLANSLMRGRSRGFSALSGGMVLRGAVPAEILIGGPLPARPILLNTPPTEPMPREAVTCPVPQPVAAPLPAKDAAKASPRRRAMTVRLDPVHHMRLRLASSFLRRSAQEICVAALEQYLASLPVDVPGGGRCACLDALAAAKMEK